jgi:two-component system sensor histidine kinase BaeS
MFLEATHRALIWAGAAGLILGGLLSYLLTRRVLSPLSRVIEVTRSLAAGDYAARVTINSTDEIGELGQAFNRMAQSLQQIERLRRTMLIDVAHELRTPLTNIRGYLEALKDGVVQPSGELVASLHDETLRLAKLVEDLLQLARAEAAAQTLERDTVFLEDLIGQARELFRARFDAKRIRVDLQLPQERHPVEVDPHKVAQAIHNLVDNAHAYTPEAGWVQLRLEREDGTARFTCANTGQGIPAADLPFVFERLYRADRSRSRDRGGSGLGLAIVKELVVAHGGTVGAASEHGTTTVWFTLPAHTEALPNAYDPITRRS